MGTRVHRPVPVGRALPALLPARPGQQARVRAGDGPGDRGNGQLLLGASPALPHRGGVQEERRDSVVNGEGHRIGDGPQVRRLRRRPDDAHGDRGAHADRDVLEARGPRGLERPGVPQGGPRGGPGGDRRGEARGPQDGLLGGGDRRCGACPPGISGISRSGGGPPGLRGPGGHLRARLQDLLGIRARGGRIDRDPGIEGGRGAGHRGRSARGLGARQRLRRRGVARRWVALDPQGRHRIRGNDIQGGEVRAEGEGALPLQDGEGDPREEARLGSGPGARGPRRGPREGGDRP